MSRKTALVERDAPATRELDGAADRSGSNEARQRIEMRAAEVLARGVEPAPERGLENGLRGGAQRRDVEGVEVGARARVRDEVAAKTVDPSPELADITPRRHPTLVAARTEMRVDRRHELVANAVALDGEVAIR